MAEYPSEEAEVAFATWLTFTTREPDEVSHSEMIRMIGFPILDEERLHNFLRSVWLAGWRAARGVMSQ